jgi:hypothetical protein
MGIKKPRSFQNFKKNLFILFFNKKIDILLRKDEVLDKKLIKPNFVKNKNENDHSPFLLGKVCRHSLFL